MKVKDSVLCAFFAAVISIGSMFMFPLPFTTVPITLQVMVIFTVSAILGAKKGSWAIFIYLLLGSFGIPIFAGMTSGFGILFGATGGFLIGFLPAGYVIGFLTEKWISPGDSHAKRYFKLSVSMVTGLLLLYTTGTLQFMMVMQCSFQKALVWAVIPFIPLDCIKIAFGVFLVPILKNSISFSLSQNKVG